MKTTLVLGLIAASLPAFGSVAPVAGTIAPATHPAAAPRAPAPATKAPPPPPPFVLEHVERVPGKALPAETDENLAEFRRDVQRQWKKCLQINDSRMIQAKDFRVSVRELCVETSRRTHHLLQISKSWKQFYQRASQQFAWYRSTADSDKTHDIDVRLLPLSMIPMKQPTEFYFPIPKKLLKTN